MSLGLSEYSKFVWFCIFYLQNILQEVLEHFSHFCTLWLFKGYLRYKTTTSQNVSSKAQIKNFFRRKIMFRFQSIQVFVFLTIPWFTKSMTSRWVLVHKTRCIFEYIFWTTNLEVTKLGQLIDMNKDNNFQWSFE